MKMTKVTDLFPIMPSDIIYIWGNSTTVTIDGCVVVKSESLFHYCVEKRHEVRLVWEA